MCSETSIFVIKRSLQNTLMSILQKGLSTSTGTKKAVHINSKVRLTVHRNFCSSTSRNEHERSLSTRQCGPHSLAYKHSTRGNNSSLYPFRSSSLSGTISFTSRSPILRNALQSVSGSEISTFSQSRFKKSFLDLLLVYPKFISFTVGDINSCI